MMNVRALLQQEYYDHLTKCTGAAGRSHTLACSSTRIGKTGRPKTSGCASRVSSSFALRQWTQSRSSWGANRRSKAQWHVRRTKIPAPYKRVCWQRATEARKAS